MNPADLIPVADSIPVPWGWFEVLLLATFACHLLLMNVLLGGSVMALLTRNLPYAPGKQLAHRLPVILALTVNLGVPPLLFLQVLYGQFLYSAAVLSAVYWMTLVALVMLAYALLYVFAGQVKKGQSAGVGLVLSVAVCALLGTSFILTNVMSLMIHPQAWTAYFTQPAGTILNLADPTILPRWLHFVLSALAVGGLFMALLNTREAKSGEAHAQARLTLGMKWFTHATLVQIAIGIWWLMAMPREVMLLFMGKNMLHTGFLVAGLVLAALSLWYGFQKRVIHTVFALLGTVLVMVGMRDLVRISTLEPYFHPTDMAVTGQYGSLVLFLVSFLLGAGAVIYMFRLHRQAGGGI
ncbi:hypothetical protein MASR1M90_15290 [Desulfovibrionales bacterium]